MFESLKSQVYCDVAPKRIALEDANKQLCDAQTRLQGIIDKVIIIFKLNSLIFEVIFANAIVMFFLLGDILGRDPGHSHKPV